MTTPAHAWLTLAEAPPIPDLRVRPYAGPDDVPALVDLSLAATRANDVPEVWSAEEMRLAYEEWSHVDPRQDDLLAFVGDQLVARSRIEWLDSNDGRRFYTLFGEVHPEWRRRGIGRALMARNERRLAEIAATHDDPRPRVLVTWAEQADPGASALVRQRGYAPVRVYHLMLRPDMEDILLPPMPDGLEVRPIGREDLPMLWEAMVEAFKDHFGGDDTSPAAYRRWSQDPNLDPSLSVVAFDGAEIAGAVMGYVFEAENRDRGYLRGWTDPVFVRRPWRRRGLASALLGRALLALRERGMTAAQLGVDSENPHEALTLYQRHRFEVVRQTTEWHKALEVEPASSR